MNNEELEKELKEIRSLLEEIGKHIGCVNPNYKHKNNKQMLCSQTTHPLNTWGKE